MLRNLQGWFDQIGVINLGPSKRTRGHRQTLIDLNPIDGFDLAVHRLREAWRLHQWKCFMSSKRHEVPELAQVSDSVILSVRGVAVGSMLSPAAIGGQGSLFSDQCVWGNCDALGTHAHICWECSQRPKKLRPKNPLDARFGWSSVASLRWLGRVQETLASLGMVLRSL